MVTKKVRASFTLFLVFLCIFPNLSAAQGADFAEFNITGTGHETLQGSFLKIALGQLVGDACQSIGCTLTADDVSTESFTKTPVVNATGGEITYEARLIVNTELYSHAVEVATRIGKPEVEALVLLTGTSTTVDTLMSRGVRVTQGRPDQCGDRTLQADEQCDDGNSENGDGCSDSCQLEVGFMCTGFVRPSSAQNTPGHRVVKNDDGTFTEDTGEVEKCVMTDICPMSTLPFQPSLWTGVFSEGDVIAPEGFYCSSFCNTFGDPRGWEMKSTSNCQFEDIDECVRGETLCDFNAICVNRAVQVYTGNEGDGYSCRCDADYFVSNLDGMGCSPNGVDLVVTVAGQKNFDPAEDPPADFAVMQTLRSSFIEHLVNRSYATVSSAVLLEGCIDYPPVLDSISADGVFATRGLWKLHVRIPTSAVNLLALSQGEMLYSYTDIGNIFDDSTTTENDAHRVHTRDYCKNDRNRQCQQDSDCLADQPCMFGMPDIDIEVLTAGGSLAPIEVEASGMEVISVSYDITQTAWHVRVRYDNTVPNTINVLYLPHITYPVDNEEFATFRHDEFACLPLGTTEFQQRRENTVCCLPTLFEDYTTTRGFEAYINDTTSVLGRGLSECNADGSAPQNATSTLLDGNLDFVTGSFARMSRSYARLDVVQTRGYQDVLLFLAEEDMRALGGVDTSIVGGYRLRFFVGMAHFKGLPNKHMHSVFSHKEVVTEITESFLFTTSSTTEFTFIRDVVVDLIQVRNKSSEVAQYQKFARVGISVPPGTTADDVYNIVPFSSARVAIGFSEDTAFASSNEYYSCLDVPRADTQNMLQDQNWCAFQDPLCKTLGPTEVTAGGQVYFIFPLHEDAWDVSSMDGSLFFEPSLYLDFMLSTKDSSGDRIPTRVQTRTKINSANIVSMCDESRLDSALAEIVTIDLMLGLTPNASQMDSTLLQRLDITRNPSSDRHMERAVSSVASNVLTVLVKGDHGVFAESYAENYGLEIEDFITMHFLDDGIRIQVEALIESGGAFEKRVEPDSYTSMRMYPTDTLLALCPLQATQAVSGCIMRKEINARMPDMTTRAITNISPREDRSDVETVLSSASEWLKNLLGSSTFINDLARGHASTIATEFDLNSRYRRGYLINPTIPWRQSQMDDNGYSSPFDLAQTSISVALVTMDKNVGESVDPTVSVSIPATLPVSADELRTNSLLRSATEISYADAAGLSPDSVEIDQDSITNVGADASRRLLQVSDSEPPQAKFDVNMGIRIADQDTAMEKAQQIVTEAGKKDSLFSKKLVRAINKNVRSVKKDMPPVRNIENILSQTEEISAPVNLEVCSNKNTRNPDIVLDPSTTGLNIGWFFDNYYVPGGGGGFEYRMSMTCTKRSLVVWDRDAQEAIAIEDLTSRGIAMGRGTPEEHLFSVDVTPRGPQTDSDWLQYERTGAYAVDPYLFVARAQYKYYGFWLDFCADAPPEMYAGRTGSNLAAFEAEWERVRTEMEERCCVCGDAPKQPGTNRNYKQQYSWMWGAGEVDPYNPKMYRPNYARESDIKYLNFQFIDQYTKARAAQYDTALVPAALTRATCAAGEYWHSYAQCKPCPLGYYKDTTGPYIAFSSSGMQKTLCSACASGLTTLVEGATSEAQCVCAAGQQPCPGDVPGVRQRLGPTEHYWGWGMENDAISAYKFHHPNWSELPNAAWSGQLWGKGATGRDVIDNFVHKAYNRTAAEMPLCAVDTAPPCRVPVRDAAGAVVTERCLNMGTQKEPKAVYGDGDALPCVESLILYVRINTEMQYVRYFYNRPSSHHQYDWIMWRVANPLSWNMGTMGVSRWGYDLQTSGTDNFMFSRTDCDTGCEPCPRGTYKSDTGSVSTCLSCPAGYVTRIGATGISQCHLQKMAQSKYTETPLYESVLGLLTFNEKTDPKWTDPPVASRSNERRCSIMGDDVSVSCPDTDYLNVLPSELPANNGRKTYYSGDTLFPDTFLVARPHVTDSVQAGQQRISFDRRKEDAGRPGYPNSDDFSKSIMSIGIALFNGYMGVSPPGFVEEMFAGGAWEPNTVINFRPRMYDWNGAIGISIASFISSKRLDTTALSLEWQHILCSDSRDQNTFYFCEAEPDYDEFRSLNKKNPYILDGIVIPITKHFETGHCWQYSTNIGASWWQHPCPDRNAGDYLLRNLDGTVHWKPFVDKDTIPDGPYFIYTIFTRNPSKACTDYGCSENVVYRNAADSTDNLNLDTTLYFLPGTEITYGVPEYAIPPADLVTSSLFNPTMGLLSKQGIPRIVFPSSGLLEHGKEREKMPLYVPIDYPTSFSTTGQSLGPAGAKILLLDETNGIPRLHVGVAVTIDWSATPTHPFGLSTDQSSVVSPLVEHVLQSIDETAKTTTVTVLSAGVPPLFYTCNNPAHGFYGVPILLDITAVEDERWCRLSHDGVDMECRQMEQSGSVVMYPDMYDESVRSAALDAGTAAPHIEIEHIDDCGSPPYVVDSTCELKQVGKSCYKTMDTKNVVSVVPTTKGEDTRYTENDPTINNLFVGATCTSDDSLDGYPCENALKQSTEINLVHELHVTHAYTHTSTKVLGDDGWEYGGSGGWCPESPTSDPSPSLTLDLGTVQDVIGIVVQTRGYECCYGQFFDEFSVEVTRTPTTVLAAPAPTINSYPHAFTTYQTWNKITRFAQAGEDGIQHCALHPNEHYMPMDFTLPESDHPYDCKTREWYDAITNILTQYVDGDASKKSACEGLAQKYHDGTATKDEVEAVLTKHACPMYPGITTGAGADLMTPNDPDWDGAPAYKWATETYPDEWAAHGPAHIFSDSTYLFIQFNVTCFTTIVENMDTNEKDIATVIMWPLKSAVNHGTGEVRIRRASNLNSNWGKKCNFGGEPFPNGNYKIHIMNPEAIMRPVALSSNKISESITTGVAMNSSAVVDEYTTLIFQEANTRTRYVRILPTAKENACMRVSVIKSFKRTEGASDSLKLAGSMCGPEITCNPSISEITHITLGTYVLNRETQYRFIYSFPAVFQDPGLPYDRNPAYIGEAPEDDADQGNLRTPPCTAGGNSCQMFDGVFNLDWCMNTRWDMYCGAGSLDAYSVGWGMRVFKHTSNNAGADGDLKSILPETEVNPNTMIMQLGDETMVFWRGDFVALQGVFPVEDWVQDLEPLEGPCEDFFWAYKAKEDTDEININAYAFFAFDSVTHHEEETEFLCPRRKPFFVWIVQANGLTTKVHVKMMFISMPGAYAASGNSDYSVNGYWVMTTYKDPASLITRDGASNVMKDMSDAVNYKYRTEEYDSDGVSTFRVNGEPEFTPELLQGSKILLSEPPTLDPCCNKQDIKVNINIAAPANIAYIDIFFPHRNSPYYFKLYSGSTADEPTFYETVDTQNSVLFLSGDTLGSFVSVPASTRSSALENTKFIIEFPMCSQIVDATPHECNPPGEIIEIFEIQGLPAQTTFSGTGPWSWSDAKSLGEVTEISADISVYDLYTFPNLEQPTAADVPFATLESVYRQWCGMRYKNDLWLQLDLGSIQAVGGLHVQSINSTSPWTRVYHKLRLWYTEESTFNWGTAVNGGILQMDENSYNAYSPDGMTSRHMFSEPIRARMIRIEVMDADEACLRIGIMDCLHACASSCVDGGVYVAKLPAEGFDVIVSGSTHSMLVMPYSSPNPMIYDFTFDLTADDRLLISQDTGSAFCGSEIAGYQRVGHQEFEEWRDSDYNGNNNGCSGSTPDTCSKSSDNYYRDYWKYSFFPEQSGLGSTNHLWYNSYSATASTDDKSGTDACAEECLKSSRNELSVEHHNGCVGFSKSRTGGCYFIWEFPASDNQGWKISRGNTFVPCQAVSPITLSDKDRLFLQSDVATTWSSITQNTVIMHPVFQNPWPIYNPDSVLGTRFLQNQYSASNPFMTGADAAALAEFPYADIHTQPSSTTGLMPALSIDAIRGYMGPGSTGFLQKIHKNTWHENSFFEMDLRVGILSHKDKRCPSTPRVRISTVPNAASAANPLVTLSTNGYRMMQWHEPALHDFMNGAYGGFPTTVCNTPVDNAPCVIASGTGSYDCLDGSQVGASWIRCPAYFFDMVFFDPASQTTETVFMRLSKTNVANWIFWPVSKTDIRGQPGEQWALSRQGHYIFTEDPLQCAECAACTVDNIVSAIDLDSPRVHVTMFIAGRELDMTTPTSTDSEWITCSRYRGSMECPMGFLLNTASACVPCEIQPSGTSNCAGTPSVFSICNDGPDPDDPTNTASNNEAHPDILDGIVMPLGSGDSNTCCSYVQPRVSILGVDPGQNTNAAEQCCYVDGAHAVSNLDKPGRIAFSPLQESKYWFSNDIASLPACEQSITTATRHTFTGLVDEVGPLPCRTDGAAFPGKDYTAYTVFDRMFLPEKGWILGALDAGDVATYDGGSVRRVCEAFAVITGDASNFNHNIPNDPFIFNAESIVFGSQKPSDGTVCPEKCETDGSYTNRDGILTWAPSTLDINAISGDYLYVYQIFSTGDSLACTGYNCLEATIQEEYGESEYADMIMKGTVDKIGFFPGSITALSTDRDSAPTGLRRNLLQYATKNKNKYPRLWPILEKKTKTIPDFKNSEYRTPQTKEAQIKYTKKIERDRRRDSVILHSRHILNDETEADSDTAQSTTFSRTILGVDPNKNILHAICPVGKKSCGLFEMKIQLPISVYCLSTLELIATKQKILKDILYRSSSGNLDFVHIASVYRPSFLETCTPGANVRRLLQTNLDASMSIIGASDHNDIEISIPNSDVTLAGIQKLTRIDSLDDKIQMYSICVGDINCIKNATMTVVSPSKVQQKENSDATNSSIAVLVVLICVISTLFLCVFGVIAYRRIKNKNVDNNYPQMSEYVCAPGIDRYTYQFPGNTGNTGHPQIGLNNAQYYGPQPYNFCNST